MVEITDFILFKKEDKFTGYAKYFNKYSYPCVIKKMKERYVVLVFVNDKWKHIGYFNFVKGKVVINGERYEQVGEIVTRDHIYTVIEESGRFLAL